MTKEIFFFENNTENDPGKTPSHIPHILPTLLKDERRTLFALSMFLTLTVLLLLLSGSISSVS